jgi:hypothetical protein
MNSKKTKNEQPSAESSSTSSQTTDRTTVTSGNTPPSESQQPDYTSAALQQAAAQDLLILKSKISTATRTSYQAFKLNYAKKLAGAGGDEKESLEAFYKKAEEHGFKKRTVQRRVQTAKAMINQSLIDTDLQARIEKSDALDADLLNEIESIIEDKIGSTSYTALMQHLGVLEKVDEADDSKKGEENESTLDVRIKISFEATYNYIDKVYELRREIRKKGVPIDSDMQEAFEALDRALVALGYYLSPNRVAYETARVESAKATMSEEDIEMVLGPKVSEV